MSTGHRVVMLCGWDVKADMAYFNMDKRVNNVKNCMIPC